MGHRGGFVDTPRKNRGYTAETSRIHRGYIADTLRIRRKYTAVTPQIHRGCIANEFLPRLNKELKHLLLESNEKLQLVSINCTR